MQPGPLSRPISFTQPRPAATTDAPPIRVRAPEPLVPNSVFIIMSFKREGMTEVLATVKQECTALGLNAIRADDDTGSNFVIIRIGQHIEEAELIICDLTHARPNVYFELGYAYGVGNGGNRVLLIAKEGTELHFDIGSLGVHEYSSPETLQAILRRNIPEMLSRCRSEAKPKSTRTTLTGFLFSWLKPKS